MAVAIAAAWHARDRLRAAVVPAAPRLRAAVAAAVVALALYAYFVRPVLSAWAGGDGNDPQLSAFARLGQQLAERFSPAERFLLRRLEALDRVVASR